MRQNKVLIPIDEPEFAKKIVHNTINILGTVDGNPSGTSITTSYGSVHLLYRNDWLII